MVWVAHALVEWERDADDQRDYGASATAAGFVVRSGEDRIEKKLDEVLERLDA